MPSQPWKTSWRIVEPLGTGGQGHTYIVSHVDRPTDRAVLKTLRNNTSPEARARMHREVATLDSLANVGLKVPRVLDSNTTDYKENLTQLYFVMDLVQGKTLRQEITARGPLPIELAQDILLDLSLTMSLAHQQGILHRDLKPENIIVRDLQPADLVIVDYGLSFNNEADESITLTGEMFGNKFLRLPDVGTRDIRSDIAGLVGIFYYCLTGQDPIQPRDEKGDPPHRRAGSFSLRSHQSKDQRCRKLELFFDVGFAHNISERFQSHAQFLSRLRICIEDAEVATVEKDPIKVARSLGALLQDRDRASQLVSFRGQLSRIVQGVHQYVNHIHNDLSPFFIAPGDRPLSFPSDIEVVDSSMLYNVTHTGHADLGCVFQFLAGARGKQCVFLRGVAYHGGSQSRGGELDAVWQDELWHNPSDTDNANAVSDHFRFCLSRTLEDFAEWILQRNHIKK